MNKVLFLCSGNYYRSRFAEIFFNALAAERGLRWKADSRGLAVDGHSHNVGPISPFALKELEIRGIDCKSRDRYPLQVLRNDLESADLIVALKEAEHRPMLAQNFPEWVHRVEFWHIDDLDCCGTKEAFAKLEKELVRLSHQLAPLDDSPVPLCQPRTPNSRPASTLSITTLLPQQQTL